jgi:transcriptional regulator with XRE-family HTH domain
VKVDDPIFEGTPAPERVETAELGDWRARLRGCLARSGKTRSQVCSEAGLNPAYLTQILEQKGATPRIDNLHKLARVLGTSVTYLVDGIELDARSRNVLALYTSLTDDRKAAAMIILEDMALASED